MYFNDLNSTENCCKDKDENFNRIERRNSAEFDALGELEQTYNHDVELDNQLMVGLEHGTSFDNFFRGTEYDIFNQTDSEIHSRTDMMKFQPELGFEKSEHV